MNVRETYIQRLLPGLSSFLQHYAGRDINLGADIESASRVAEILNSLPELLLLEDSVPAEAQGLKKHDYKEKIRKHFPNYGFVVDFANVVKHKRLNGTTRTITNLAEVQTRIAVCIYRDAEGQYTGTLKLLWLIRPPQEAVDLRRAIVSSAAYWTDKLVCLGIIQPVNPALFSFSEQLSRAEAASQSDILVLSIEGDSPSHQCEVLEYDYETRLLVGLRKETKFDIELRLAFKGTPSPFINAA